MKRIFTLTIASLSLLLAASCSRELTPDMPEQEGLYALNLNVACTKPGTRADVVKGEKPGEDTYNENKVDYVDWFLFKSSSDEGDALKHGRASITQETGEDGSVKPFKIVEKMAMDDLIKDNGNSFYVFAIANLPEDVAANHEAMPITLSGLKALKLAASFNVNPFAAQDNFVMVGGQDVSFVEKGLTEVTANLKRLASKISINMNVAPAIDELTTLPNGERSYTRTWYPDLSTVQVYLSFANAKTDLEGSPQEYNQDGFFTYNRYAFNKLISYTGNTSTPSSEVPTVTPEWDKKDPEWKWNVTGSPFYTYPMNWNADSPQAPFLKVIMEWKPYKETIDASCYEETEDGDKFIRSKRDKAAEDPVLGQTEFYYKVTIPANNLTLEANDWYDLTFDVAILGSTSDDLPVEIAGQYCVIDWSDPGITAGGDLKQGSYLSTASDTYYIYGGDDIEIPVLSSHDITTTVTGVQFYDYSSTTPANRTSLTYLTRQPSTSDSGREKFTFTHALMTDIENATSSNKPDVAIYTFTVRITNTAGNTKTITIVQQPPLTIISDRNTATQRNQYGYAFVNGNHSYYGGIEQKYLAGNGNENANPNMYIISASVAPSNYIIADPRSSSISYLGSNSYSWTNTSYRVGATGDNFRMSYYYPTEETDNGKNIIAPSIRIASSYGITSSLSSFQYAQRRCATYQEDGIPAGRWRIPTKAEIEFMIKLSNVGSIPSLFSPETNGSYNRGGYYSADGGVVFPWTDGTVGYRSKDEMSTANYNNYVRCVYDEWYWGTDDRQTTRDRFYWGDKQIQ